jgi:hypothetical protein
MTEPESNARAAAVLRESGEGTGNLGEAAIRLGQALTIEPPEVRAALERQTAAINACLVAELALVEAERAGLVGDGVKQRVEEARAELRRLGVTPWSDRAPEELRRTYTPQEAFTALWTGAGR